MVAEVEAVVADDEDDGVVRQALLVQRGQDAAHVVVHKAHARVVGGDRLAGRCGVGWSFVKMSGLPPVMRLG